MRRESGQRVMIGEIVYLYSSLRVSLGIDSLIYDDRDLCVYISFSLFPVTTTETLRVQLLAMDI
jgi:hypothetical protein